MRQQQQQKWLTIRRVRHAARRLLLRAREYYSVYNLVLTAKLPKVQFSGGVNFSRNVWWREFFGGKQHAAVTS